MTSCDGFSPDGMPDFDDLIRTNFSDPGQRIRLAKGDFLLHQNQFNDRLYVVLEGRIKGYVENPDGTQSESFLSSRYGFVGAPSFFSGTFVSLTHAVAEQDSEVAFLTHEQARRIPNFAETFLPVVVQELMARQQRIQKIGQEKERALRALLHQEKMASLGQMSAGIAHELNNAVAVLQRNTDWLRSRLSEIIRERHPSHFHFFNLGVEQGRRVSTQEARGRAKILQRKYAFTYDLAMTIANIGMSDEDVQEIRQSMGWDPDQIGRIWELGATLNDMVVAAEHAGHVVKSVKALGAQRSERRPDMDLNECIREAQTLLASPLRKIKVTTSLSDIPPFTGNHGEWVQVFVNMMQNACDSLLASGRPDAELRIASARDSDALVLSVEDNGPGIPPDVLPHIFEPCLTTKTDGATVGLGLGLTIVQRLVESYGGRIGVESRPGRTVFTVRLPLEKTP